MGTPVYDGHGNTTQLFGETHTYDVANRHVSTSKASPAASGTAQPMVQNPVDWIRLRGADFKADMVWLGARLGIEFFGMTDRARALA